MDKTQNQTKIFRFTDQEKHQMIQEVLSKGLTKQVVWKKYTGRDHEHGKILAWMRQFGYNSSISRDRSIDASILKQMAQKHLKPPENESDKEFENLQLKKRIVELEKQLKDAELKAIAFSTMIDIAEKEFKIPIKKKFNTKP